MALTDYVIMPGADYQDACDAIREKTGKSDLIVSGDMGEEIRGISGGGEDLLSKFLEGTLTRIEDDSVYSIEEYACDYYDNLQYISFTEAESIAQRAFYYCKGLTDVNFPKLTTIHAYAFSDCTGLTALNFPNLRTLGSGAFQVCTNLSIFNATNIKTVESLVFMGCESLTGVEFPLLTTIGASVFRNCTALIFADLGLINSFSTEVFRDATLFNTLVLRGSDSICGLTNVNAFQGTPFSSAQTCGNCFVPRDLVSQYQDATNWSTLRAAGSCVFYPLEDYTVDGTTTGEMDWDKVNALPHENDSSSVSPV